MWLACLGFLYLPSSSQAASGVVEFSASQTEVKKDDIVTVVCRVSSQEGFCDVTMKLSYDSDILQFVEGGKKVSGGDGHLSIKSIGNENTVATRTYSLQFVACGVGAVSVQLEGTPKILDSEGKKLSVSSNRIVLSVTERGQQEDAQDPAALPAEPTPTPVPLNTNTKLKALSIDAVTMAPQFNTVVLDYTIKVDCNTDKLYYNVIPANSKQRIRLKITKN